MKIVEAVKKELKLTKLDVKLKPVTSATRIPLIANGTVDLECGSTTNNARAAEAGRLHHHAFRDRNRTSSKKPPNIKNLNDLKGKTSLHLRHDQHQAANRDQTHKNLGMKS